MRMYLLHTACRSSIAMKPLRVMLSSSRSSLAFQRHPTSFALSRKKFTKSSGSLEAAQNWSASQFRCCRGISFSMRSHRSTYSWAVWCWQERTDMCFHRLMYGSRLQNSCARIFLLLPRRHVDLREVLQQLLLPQRPSSSVLLLTQLVLQFTTAAAAASLQ